MTGIQNPDVLVVGAGPVGMFSALVLADRGVHVELLDAAPSTAARSYALALHPRSLELLHEVDLAVELIEKGWRVETLGLYDGEALRASLDLGSLGSRFPFVLVVPQSALESALKRRLEERGVPIRWNHRVAGPHLSDDAAFVTIDQLAGAKGNGNGELSGREVVESTSVAARFVIGADGHKSAVRQALGIGFDSRGDAEIYAVFEFDEDESPGHEMRAVLRRSSKNALWALGKTRCRWSFQLDTSETLDARYKARLDERADEDELPKIAGEFLGEIAGSRAPWHRPEMSGVDWCTIVQFERRLARSFGRQNVWLAGDAAHVTGPIGVQSMNLGLLEGWELATRMSRIVLDGEPESLLDAYGHERQLDWHMLLSGDDGIEATDSADAWVAKNRGRLLDCIPATGDALVGLLGQIGLRPL